MQGSIKVLSENRDKLERTELIQRQNMSYEERIEAHENARQLLEDLKKAGESLNAKSQGTAPTSLKK